MLGMVVGSEHVDEVIEAKNKDEVINKLLKMRLRIAKDDFYIPWHNVIGVEIKGVDDDG